MAYMNMQIALSVMAVVFGLAASSFAQVPIYTNADLGKPRQVVTPTITADEYRSLLAHQFVYVPTRSPWLAYGFGPSVAIAATPSSPYDSFLTLPAPTRLDGTPYSEPPWEQRWYVGRGFRAGGRPVPHAPGTRRADPQRPGSSAGAAR